MTKLPVLLSIPHGGTKVPPELRDRVCINRFDLHDDTDPFVLKIYDLGDHVVEVVSTEVARTFVDLNRAPDDKAPENPDGVTKSMTCFQKPIYFEGKELDNQLVDQLLKKYYQPYHQRIRQALEQPGIEFAFDCHSVLAVGPPISPDTDRKRPLVCLGNRHGQTCPMEFIERLSNCFCKAFSFQKHEVSINQPFAGGYISRHYGQSNVPWVQIELNRALYLSPPWFDRDSLTMDESRLQELKQTFEKTLILFFERGTNARDRRG